LSSLPPEARHRPPTGKPRLARGECPWLLLLGGTSTLGMACARQFASAGFNILLAGRRSDALIENASGLEHCYGVETAVVEFDAMEFDPEFVARLPVTPDVALTAVGLLDDLGTDDLDFSDANRIATVNHAGLMPVIGRLADLMRNRGRGHIIGIASMAGVRGRAINAVYGSAKAGFIAFLSGLRQSLFGSGVHVMTVIPGYVATRMTRDRELPRWLTLEPDQAALRIYQSYRHRRSITYLGLRWRLIAIVLRLIPEWVFKRLGRF